MSAIDEYISYSPYLSTHDSVEVEDKTLLNNYLNFLSGEDFTMTSDDESFFSKMGHPNTYRYPLDYWKLKLQFRWIRDNFYKYNLKDRDGGLYGLVEVPMKREIEKLYFNTNDGHREIVYNNIDSSIAIAGGCALYLAGVTDTFTDIDIFPMNREKAIELACMFSRPICKNSTYSSHTHIEYRDIEEDVSYSYYIPIQLIKREYSCPSEIVYGFDIDACGYILTNRDGTPRLYATPLALHATKTREIWLDAEYTEERYFIRLFKYVSKGFHLRLPLIDIDNLNSTYIRERYGDRRIYNTMLGCTSRYGNSVAVLGKMISDIYYRADIYNLGSMLLISHFFDIGYKSHIAKACIDHILLRPDKEDTIEDYDRWINEDRPRPSLDDWVCKVRMNLREEYPSKVKINSVDHLLEIYRASPLYKEK